MLGLGLSIPQVAVRGGGEQLSLISGGVLGSGITLTRTTTATYWGL